MHWMRGTPMANKKTKTMFVWGRRDCVEKPAFSFSFGPLAMQISNNSQGSISSVRFTQVQMRLINFHNMLADWTFSELRIVKSSMPGMVTRHCWAQRWAASNAPHFALRRSSNQSRSFDWLVELGWSHVWRPPAARQHRSDTRPVRILAVFTTKFTAFRNRHSSSRKTIINLW